jgi:L-alanine-DL-glutamate epimerase-like enolase superfamily enzyme
LRIDRIETLHCDGGWRVLSFLKITTDTGPVGWAEYNECYGSRGLTAVIDGLGELITGVDPRPVTKLIARLAARTRQVRGGIAQQAIAAIENALLDIKAKDLGIAVCELFGGPVRTRLPLYWSHCGSYRLQFAGLLGVAPVRGYEDLRSLGHEVASRGFSALKTNVFDFDAAPPALIMPGFGWSTGYPELNLSQAIVEKMAAQLSALREGAGQDTGIMLDLNYNFRTEGFIRAARELEPFNLHWLELDTPDPAALMRIRAAAPMPIASGEAVFGARSYQAYLDRGAMDVAIVDVIWNGFREALAMAAMADAYETNVAPHNFFGPLATLISAQFCAAIPNFRIMEIDVDDVPWRDDLVSRPPVTDRGHLLVSAGPGWGADVNEDVAAAHPPRW